jgi:LEA14-like dessication related protein
MNPQRRNRDVQTAKRNRDKESNLEVSVKPKLFYLPLIWIALVCGGCSSLLEKVVQKPKVELSRVEIQETNLTSTLLMFVFEIDNPNAFGIRVDEINYKVHLADTEFAATKISQATEVPAKGKSLIQLPLPVSYQKLWSGMGQLFSRQTITYRIEGDARAGGLTVPFRESGEVSLK